MARINFETTVELHRQFKSATAAEGATIKDVLAGYMRRYVDGDDAAAASVDPSRTWDQEAPTMTRQITAHVWRERRWWLVGLAGGLGTAQELTRAKALASADEIIESMTGMPRGYFSVHVRPGLPPDYRAERARERTGRRHVEG